MKKPLSEESKKEKKILFVNACLELMKTDNLKDISIRKIADVAGFHNSTIYLYFNDIQELLSIASVRYFQSYAKDLSLLNPKECNPYEHYMKIWEIFCEVTFPKADIFYQFFYGKYGDDITTIMNEYYTLFPEEKIEMSENLKLMFYGKNVLERCKTILIPITNTSYSKINDSNFDVANQIISDCLKTILQELTTDNPVSVDDAINRMISAIEFVVCD